MHYHVKGKNYEAPQIYRDLDGNMRNFSVINHDVRPSFALHPNSPFNEQWDYLMNIVSQLSKEVVEQYLVEIEKESVEDVNFGELVSLAMKTENKACLKVVKQLSK